MKKRFFNSDVILRLLVVFVLLFCIGWTGWRAIVSAQHSSTLSTYQNEVEKIDSATYDQLKKEATKYNDLLYQTQNVSVSGISDMLSDENYQKMLRVNDSEVMARINIPKINVQLPVYHGTSEEVLMNGIGHLQTSSLPIGGKNTRAILSGHRGMAEADMFTRLDELEKGDLIFIEVLNEKLAYLVTDMEVILPEETENLNIEGGEDILTLVTCTPIYVNSHRLIVNAKRVDFTEVEDQQKAIFNIPSHPLVLLNYAIPIIGLILIIYLTYTTYSTYRRNKINLKKNTKE